MEKDLLVKSKLFTRRAFALLSGKLALMSILVGRLYYLQVLKSSEYKTLSENNRVKLIPLIPKRGIISDQKNRIIATNRECYQIIMDKVLPLEEDKIIEKISHILNLDPNEIRAQIDKKEAKKYNNQILLFDDLNWEDLIKLEVQLFDLQGIKIEIIHLRYYPYNFNTAHLLGYIATEKDKNIPNAAVKVGKTGIEKAFNSELFGQIGLKKIEVNAYGKIIGELAAKEPTNGNKIKLSVDIDLQNFTMNLLAEKSGASVVIDIENGNILAIASTPSFDANLFSKGVSYDYWNEVSNNKNLPLLNRAISSQYPPGSIFKLIVAIAALEDGISADLKFECSGYVTAGDRKFHCWRHEGHGVLNMTQAITYSCNCYFFNIAKKLGIEKIATTSAKFGLGKRLDIEIDGELKGLIPSKKWKKQKLKKDWQIGDTFNTAIGQGYVLTTPLQLTALAAKIASSKNISPSLLFQKNRNFESLDCNHNNLTIIRNAMDRVVNQPGGSAYNNRIIEEDMAMGGKTGTSQVISKKNIKDDLSRSDIEKSNRNHGIFIGFAPVANPKYACCVVIENGGSGGSAAAPLAKQIMIEAQKAKIGLFDKD